MMMDSHSTSGLPPLVIISQNAGKAEMPLMMAPQKYTRVRPSRSDIRPKYGMKKHMMMAAAITPPSAWLRLTLTFCVSHEMTNTPKTLKNTPSM